MRTSFPLMCILLTLATGSTGIAQQSIPVEIRTVPAESAIDLNDLQRMLEDSGFPISPLSTPGSLVCELECQGMIFFVGFGMNDTGERIWLHTNLRKLEANEDFPVDKLIACLDISDAFHLNQFSLSQGYLVLCRHLYNRCLYKEIVRRAVQ